MRLLLVILCLTFALAAGVSAQDAAEPEPGAAGVGDSLYPGFGNGGYDVQHYIVHITANPQEGSLSGNVSIEAKATDALTRFNLDLIGFTIDGITINGLSATFTRDGQELQITPGQPIRKDTRFTVVVAYHGKPSSMTSVAIPVQTGWVRYQNGEGCPCSYVLSEPDGSAGWFPVNDHPLDKATYTFLVTVPKPYEVAANGVLVDVVDERDATTTITKVNQPMASYLATVNIGQFDLVTEAGTHGVPIRNYFDVGVDEATRDLFDAQDEMIGYFESLFGEYPFDVYGAVMLNRPTGGALETQTLSIFGTDTIAADSLNSELVIAHELAHQWFGDSVSVADWSDIWLNEGFASYAEGLWIEHTQGAQALETWIRDQYEYVAGNDSLPPPAKPAADDLFNDSVYTRGALTLHALRLRIGDEDFFALLKAWYERYKDGNATSTDLMVLASQISGIELSEFFQVWLDQQPLPPIPEMGLESEAWAAGG